MPKTATKEKPTTETRKQESGLFQSGLLVYVGISFWRGRKVLKAADLGLKAELPEIFRLGSKYLIPQDIVQHFTQIESRVDYVLSNQSFPFPVGKVRFVPYTTLPKVMDELQKAEETFRTEIETFFAHYDEYRERMLVEFAPWRDALEAEYPPAEALRPKFRFLSYYYKVDSISPVSLSKALQVAGERRETIKNAEKGFQTTLDAFVRESVELLRSQVNETAQDLLEKLQKGELLNARSFTSIRGTIAQFRALNFADDVALARQLKDLEDELDKTEPKTASDSDSFRQAIQAVARVAQETKDIELIGLEYKRRIDLPQSED